MWIRLDALVPNTPRPGGGSRSINASQRKTALETPSVSRTKRDTGSSPAGFKTPYQSGETNGVGRVYVSGITSLYEC